MPRLDTNQDIRLAHGFNEELTIILNTATLAADLLGPEHPANPILTELKQSAIRCTELTRRFVYRGDAARLLF
jgi:hypothetical protein